MVGKGIVTCSNFFSRGVGFRSSAYSFFLASSCLSWYITCMKFKIIYLESVEESTICDLSELSQKLSPNSEILQIFDNGSLEAIGFVSQETLVGFAIDFAQYALDNYCSKDKVDARSTEALIVARRYLKKQASLQEVKAAYVAANAAYAAAYAAYAYAAGAAARVRGPHPPAVHRVRALHVA